MFEKLRAKFTPELSPHDRYLTLNEESRENLSETAKNLFLKANMGAPTSITAQGALIALYSQEMGVKDPEVLGLCLAHDQDRLEYIAAKANNIHAVREVGHKAPEITPSKLEVYVKDDFMVAGSFMNHTPEELQYIATTMYRGYLSKLTNRVGVSIDENAYHQRALSIHPKA